MQQLLDAINSGMFDGKKGAAAAKRRAAGAHLRQREQLLLFSGLIDELKQTIVDEVGGSADRSMQKYVLDRCRAAA